MKSFKKYLEEIYRLTPARRAVLDRHEKQAQAELETIHMDAGLRPPPSSGKFGQIPREDQHSSTLKDPRYVTPSGVKTQAGFKLAMRMRPHELTRDRVQLLRLMSVPQERRFASSGGSPWLHGRNEFPGQERMHPTRYGEVAKRITNKFPGVGETQEEPDEVLKRVERERDEDRSQGKSDRPEHRKFISWYHGEYLPNIRKPQDAERKEVRDRKMPPESRDALPDGLGDWLHPDVASDEHIKGALQAVRRDSRFHSGTIGNRDPLKTINDALKDIGPQFKFPKE